MSLMQNLKRHVERAKNSYLSFFSGFKTVSKRRAADLQKLMGIVTRPSHDIFSKIAEIKDMLKKMKTGWLFFDFGRSRLKNLVKDEIKKFKKIHVDAYMVLPPKAQATPIQPVVQAPVAQKAKTEKFSIAACKKHLQFKPKPVSQQNTKPMIQLEPETNLKNSDFLM